MRKEEADVLKKEFNAETASTDVLEFMSSNDLSETESLLEFLERYLQAAITNYSLDEAYDLFDTENEELVRTLWFSRGMEDTFICLTPNGSIKAIDPDFPMELLANVATALAALNQE